MASVEYPIEGRLGRYTLALSNLNEAPKVGPTGTQIVSDVVVQYGDMSIEDPEMPILKSTLELTFSDPQGSLADEAERSKIKAELRGPGVNWQGRLTPFRTLRPLNYSTRPSDLTLSFYGGIADLKQDTESVLASKEDKNESFDRSADFAEAVAVIGNVVELGFPEAGGDNPGGVVVTNVEFENNQGDVYGESGLDQVLGQQGLEAETLEDDLRFLCRALQARAFRTFNTGRFVIVPASQPKGGLSGTNYYIGGDPGRVSRGFGDITIASESERVRLFEKAPDVLEDDPEFGFQPHTQSGAVEYELGEDYNLLANAEFAIDLATDNPNFAEWDTNTDVDQVTAADVQFGDPEPPKPEGDLMAFGVDSASTESATQEVGSVPVADSTSGSVPSGLLLTFSGYKIGSPDSTPSLTVELELDPSDGSSKITKTVSGTDAFQEEASLILPLDKPGDVTIKASGVDSAWYAPQLRFIAGERKIADSVIYRNEASDGRMKPEESGGARIRRSSTIQFYKPKTYRNTRFSATSGLASAFNATDRLRRRPASGVSVKTRVLGLHGPETRLVLRNPNSGNLLNFYAGRGRKINVTEGTTELADSQLPTDAQ